MKKATFLLLVSGVFITMSCQKEKLTGDSGSESLNAKRQASMSKQDTETSTAPKRTRGNTRLTVMEYGAVGDGIHDDTQAFQDAINALPEDGGTVYVPDGTYLIKADTKDVKRKTVEGNCIRLRSNMHLQMSPHATLVQKATDAWQAYVVYGNKVHDVEVSGGNIIGERDRHLNTVGEGGHGVHLSGCERVTVSRVNASEFWGDGFYAGHSLKEDGPQLSCNDIVFDHIVSTHNRRQGLSIGSATNIQVLNSEFNDTEGTAPQCGIDIEPIQGHTTNNVLIKNCVMRNNHAYGILLYKFMANVTIEHCEFVDNSVGIVCEAPVDTYLAFNEMHNNTNNGLVIKAEVDGITLEHNKFYENNGHASRPSALSITGVSAETARDMLIRPDAINVNILNNLYK